MGKTKTDSERKKKGGRDGAKQDRAIKKMKKGSGSKKRASHKGGSKKSKKEKAEDLAVSKSKVAAPIAISALDQNTREYFSHLRSILRGSSFDLESIDRDGVLEGFKSIDDEDQRQSLLFNAWTEVQGKEYKLATDPRCSLVLQDLLRATLIASSSSSTSPFSKRIGDFFSRCMGQYVNLAIDSLGSRVLETTLTCLHSLFLASVRGKGTKEGEEDSVLPIDVESLILDFCRELEEHWVKMLSDRNGSFIVRLVFRFLAGHVELKDQLSRPSTSYPTSTSYPSSNYSQQHQQQEVVESKIIQVPYSFKTTLDYIVQSIDTTIDTNRLADLSFHPNAGPSLKILIGALGEQQETSKLVRKVLKMDVVPEEDPYFQHLLRVQKKKLEDEERRQQEYDEGAGELETTSDKKKKRKQKGKKGSESMYSTSGGSTSTGSGTGGKNEEVPDPVSPFNAQVEALVLDNVGSVVLEQIIKISNQQLFGEIMALPSIQDRLSELSQHPTGNFIVQRMIERATTGEGQEEGDEKKETFLLIVNGLLPHLSLFADRPGVILKLVEACSNDLNLQQLVFDAIFKTVTSSASSVSGSSEKLPFVHALLMLQGKVTSFKKSPQQGSFSILGSLITKALLDYKREVITPLVQSFQDLTPDTLIQIATHPSASRVLEHFLQGSQFPTSVQRQIISKLKGHFVELARDRFGSHCVDHCFKAAPIDLKEEIAQELEVSLSNLQHDRYAVFVIRNCKVQMYSNQRQVWRQEQINLERKRKAFLAVIQDIAPPRPIPSAAKQQPVSSSSSTRKDEKKTKKRKLEEVKQEEEEEEEEEANDAMKEISRIFENKKVNNKEKKSKKEAGEEDKSNKRQKKEKKEGTRKKSSSSSSTSLDFVFKAIKNSKVDESGGDDKKKKKKQKKEKKK